MIRKDKKINNGNSLKESDSGFTNNRIWDNYIRLSFSNMGTYTHD